MSPTATNSMTPTPTPPEIILGGGTSNTCIVDHSQQLRCFGFNESGVLGYGDTTSRGATTDTAYGLLPAVDLGSGALVEAIGSRWTHSCALLSTGAIKCWGDGLYGVNGNFSALAIGDESGEMGNNLPTVSFPTGRTATALAVGSRSNCAILDDASLVCWGETLGTRDYIRHGEEANSMGDNLPTIDLGTGRTVTAVAVGDMFACALLDDASLKCFGSGASGRLGTGDETTIGEHPFIDDMGDNLAALDFGSGLTVRTVALGENHACVILSNGALKCWGDNQRGQLGLGNTQTYGDGPGEMGDNLPTVDLGTGRTAVALSLAVYHTCALLDNGTAKCWGEGFNGQLGNESSTDIGDEPGEMGDNLPAINVGTGLTVKRIATGFLHTCMLLNTDAIKCFGYGGHGALGYGDTTRRGREPGEMGDNLPAYAADPSTGIATMTPTRTTTRTPTP
jgi:alpha-tubulin suppressor-like RCC1 family protein